MIFYHVSCFLQVYERLQRLNFSMSHSQLLRLGDKLGVDHDGRVLNWRDSLSAKRKTSPPTQVHACYKMWTRFNPILFYSQILLLQHTVCHMEVIVSAHLMNLKTQTLTQVQIIPTKAVSPITEEEYYYTSDSTDESESERVLSKSDSHPP